MTVEVKDMPELRVGAVSHVGPYNSISESFGRLGAIAGQAGLVGRPGVAMMAIYHDDPKSTPQAELRSDAALVVPPDVPMPAGLKEMRLAAGRYACTTHVGPYSRIGHAWERFRAEWLPASGHEAGPGVTFEIYRNTPENARPEELRTELYLPIT